MTDIEKHPVYIRIKARSDEMRAALGTFDTKEDDDIKALTMLLAEKLAEFAHAKGAIEPARVMYMVMMVQETLDLAVMRHLMKLEGTLQ